MTAISLSSRRSMALGIVFVMAASIIAPGAALANTDPPRTGKVTGRSVLAGLTSLIIWPGIGQAINSDPGKKVATHAVIGLLPPYRLWSGYDALVNRKGGYWDGRI